MQTALKIKPSPKAVDQKYTFETCVTGDVQERFYAIEYFGRKYLKVAAGLGAICGARMLRDTLSFFRADVVNFKKFYKDDTAFQKHIVFALQAIDDLDEFAEAIPLESELPHKFAAHVYYMCVCRIGEQIANACRAVGCMSHEDYDTKTKDQ